MSTRRGFLLQSLGLAIASRLPFSLPNESDIEYAEAQQFPSPWLEVWCDGLKYDGTDGRWAIRCRAGRCGWLDRLVILPPPPPHVHDIVRVGEYRTPDGVRHFEVRELPCPYPSCANPHRIDRVYGHVVIRLRPDCPADVRADVERGRRQW